MPFYKRYQLGAPVGDDEGSRVFSAREIATSRELRVYLFAGADENRKAALLRQIEELGAEDRRLVVETGDNQGTLYIVTEVFEGGAGLHAWLRSKARPPAPEKAEDQFAKAGMWRAPLVGTPPAVSREIVPKEGPPPPVAPAPAPAALPEPGEFTSMFATPVLPAAAAPAPPSASPEPGEFTSMFAAPVPSAAPVPAPPAPPPAAVPSTVSAAPEPGDFTRMFAAPVPPASQRGTSPLPPPAAPGRPAEPGEFTSLFTAPAPVAPAPAPPAPPAAGPGEFTNFFQSPMAPRPMGSGSGMASPQPPPPPSVQPAAPGGVGEFTRMFGPGDRPGPMPASPSLPALPSSGATNIFDARPLSFGTPAPPAAADPRGFSQMFSAVPQRSVGAEIPMGAAPAEPAVPPPPARSPVLVLVVVLGGLLVLALIVILIFALKR